jgi:hypothetical protein
LVHWTTVPRNWTNFHYKIKLDMLWEVDKRMENL